ncbi:hypothetical protein OMK64_05145 [Cellulomonas fimi]|uniref:hypothetical protein n=1 Tax=Cellulomonas fimi TaxID=1708 RepID=UPI00234DA50E|nr:hypothetical protein [Cellulomonas fimi]MDC7120914.1 hypothetical protein [Cellulomonas fimi]
MGTWGAGIFANDEACDVRDVYRDLLGDGVPDDEAEQRVLEEFRDEEGSVPSTVWLALAATQSRSGRLSETTRGRALHLIDSGADLDAWADADPGDRRRRATALARLRAQLVGPQPEPRPVRREWKYRTDLVPGDVLALPVEDERRALLRVVGVEHDRFSDFVLVELLAADGRAGELSDLPAARHPRTGRPERWSVAKNHSREPDWSDVGLVRVGTTPGQPDDRAATAGADADRELLAAVLAEGGAAARTVDGTLLALDDRAPFVIWELLPREVASAVAAARL